MHRDSTRYTDGKHLRDLEALNRDIKDVLYITASEDPSTLQPDNAVQVPPPSAFADLHMTGLALGSWNVARRQTSGGDPRLESRASAGSHAPAAWAPLPGCMTAQGSGAHAHLCAKVRVEGSGCWALDSVQLCCSSNPRLAAATVAATV